MSLFLSNQACCYESDKCFAVCGRQRWPIGDVPHHGVLRSVSQIRLISQQVLARMVANFFRKLSLPPTGKKEKTTPEFPGQHQGTSSTCPKSISAQDQATCKLEKLGMMHDFRTHAFQNADQGHDRCSLDTTSDKSGRKDVNAGHRTPGQIRTQRSTCLV